MVTIHYDACNNGSVWLLTDWLPPKVRVRWNKCISQLHIMFLKNEGKFFPACIWIELSESYLLQPIRWTMILIQTLHISFEPCVVTYGTYWYAIHTRRDHTELVLYIIVQRQVHLIISRWLCWYTTPKCKNVICMMISFTVIILCNTLQKLRKTSCLKVCFLVTDIVFTEVNNLLPRMFE